MIRFDQQPPTLLLIKFDQIYRLVLKLSEHMCPLNIDSLVVDFIKCPFNVFILKEGNLNTFQAPPVSWPLLLGEAF